MNSEGCAPVAFFVFNRPATTRRVFERIRAARPPRLLVVADGPRADRPGEAARCAEARAAAGAVDWPCQVDTHYAEANLGCRRRISSGIDWVFSQVEEAIILEDDCLPEPDFFRFCSELLARYRDDARIFMVSGNNFLFGREASRYSYYFTRYLHIWGWASWRRAWAHYDVAMRRWPELRQGPWLADELGMPEVAGHFHNRFDATHAGLDTWDYQWVFSAWLQHGCAVAPARNLVRNIGVGAGATNTHNAPVEALAPTAPLAFPLRHPPGVRVNRSADRLESRLLGLRKLTTLERWQRSALKRLGKWPGRNR